MLFWHNKSDTVRKWKDWLSPDAEKALCILWAREKIVGNFYLLTSSARRPDLSSSAFPTSDCSAAKRKFPRSSLGESQSSMKFTPPLQRLQIPSYRMMGLSSVANTFWASEPASRVCCTRRRQSALDPLVSVCARNSASFGSPVARTLVKSHFWEMTCPLLPPRDDGEKASTQGSVASSNKRIAMVFDGLWPRCCFVFFQSAFVGLDDCRQTKMLLRENMPINFGGYLDANGKKDIYLFMYICVYIYVCIYVYMYTYIYMYIYVCVYVYMRMGLCVCVCSQTQIHTLTHTHTLSYKHTWYQIKGRTKSGGSGLALFWDVCIN